MVSVLVRRVQEGGVADTLGVSEGDEVVLVNDSSVIELGWAGVTMALEGKLENFGCSHTVLVLSTDMISLRVSQNIPER